MHYYRRHLEKGGSYFFTVVTEGRQRLFVEDKWRALLRTTLQHQIHKTPFLIDAIVLLPDHLHTIWTLPPDDDQYPSRWKRIKSRFTREYLKQGGVECPVSDERVARGEHGVWQLRYWEHTVRDEDDFKRCLDYIHWNPVKHGLVDRPREYPWSTFLQYVQSGVYDINWVKGCDIRDVDGAEWE